MDCKTCEWLKKCGKDKGTCFWQKCIKEKGNGEKKDQQDITSASGVIIADRSEL